MFHLLIASRVKKAILYFRLLHPPLLPRQTRLPPRQSRPGTAGTQTQDRSCWIQPVQEWRSLIKVNIFHSTSLQLYELFSGGKVAEWFRTLDFKSGRLWFKSSTLTPSGFVLGNPELNSSTALCK